MKRKYDWAAIQRYYDQGHSLQDCKAKFGFANGAWDAAVVGARSCRAPTSSRAFATTRANGHLRARST